MKSNFLFPSKYKRLGWIILIPTTLIALPCIFYEASPEFLDFQVFRFFSSGIFEENTILASSENNILNEILGIAVIIGALMVAFSKEKDEDELILNLRLKCLVWATFWNYILLIIAFILFYDFTFFWFMVLNMFTILFLFIFRFNWLLMKMRKSLANEE